MKHYRLVVDEEQLRVICEALDLYMRVGMGQWEEVIDYTPQGYVENLDRQVMDGGLKHRTREALRAHGSSFCGFDTPGTYYGIGSAKVSKKAKIAHDMWEILDNRDFQPVSDKPSLDLRLLTELELLAMTTREKS